MTFKRPNRTTHQGCRSLLQKAVRRGYSGLVQQVVEHLVEIGDRAWLRQRSVVITVEECWPIVHSYEYSIETQDIAQHLCAVASTVKNKNAAGLGALAYALSQGDTTVIKDDHLDAPIHMIENGIQRPADYWSWLARECGDDFQLIQVWNLANLHKKCSWPWDKAFVLAAGYLLINDALPPIQKASSPLDGDFPLWVALDRHTPQGKVAIKKAAERLRLTINQVSWMSFYCESALTNQSQPAYWWERENIWRLEKVGLTIPQAEEFWLKGRPIMIEVLQPETEILRSHIRLERQPIQPTLF